MQFLPYFLNQSFHSSAHSSVRSIYVKPFVFLAIAYFIIVRRSISPVTNLTFACPSIALCNLPYLANRSKHVTFFVRLLGRPFDLRRDI